MTSTLPPPPQRAGPEPGHSSPAWRVTPSSGVVAALLMGGLAFDLGLRHPAGILSLAAVAMVAGAALVGRWVRGRTSLALLALALLPAALLVVRDSPWLIPLNAAAALGLLLLAAATRPEPGAIGRAAGRLVRPRAALEPIGRSSRFVRESLRATTNGKDALAQRLRRILTGIALATPIVVLLIGLLAAADALFRSWIDIPFSPSEVVGHAFIVALGAILTTGFAAHGAWALVAEPRQPRQWLGPIESTVVLGAIVAVFVLFVVAQVVAITGGAAYVQRTTGLTYADYAREGFFQLIAAAAITLLVLTIVARHQRDASASLRRRVLWLELATVGLTLIVVLVAIRRLFLYEAEFGLTMLRFSTIVFAGFIGFVFVITGLHLADRLRHSPVSVSLTGALALLIAVNLINPERLVAQRNIDRFGGSGELDVDYLVAELGADAIPTILTDPIATAALCRRPLEIDDRVIVFNLSRSRAASALEDACA